MKNSYTICENLGYIGFMWEIGSRLRERREAEKLDIGQVAEYEEVSKSYISQLETGRNKPNWDLLARLARRYNTSTDYILGLTDDPRPATNGKLPEGATQILEIMAGLSPKGREQLLAIAKSIYEFDKDWQEIEMMTAIAASIVGKSRLEQLRAEFGRNVARLGSREAALDALISQSSLPHSVSDDYSE